MIACASSVVDECAISAPSAMMVGDVWGAFRRREHSRSCIVTPPCTMQVLLSVLSGLFGICRQVQVEALVYEL